MPGEYSVADPTGMIPRVGAVVLLRVYRESYAMQAGFYYAFSEAVSDVWDDFDLLRFYFHATAASAPNLVGFLTTRLNRYHVPFRLKTLADPAGYGARMPWCST